MTNYSLMSDLEINIEVAIIQGFAREKCELGWSGKSDVGVEWSDKTGYPTRSFNFCKNPNDAWPIILTNHIAITPYRHTLPCAWPTAFGITSKFYTEDANPLRAAMIVYLKMKSSE